MNSGEWTSAVRDLVLTTLAAFRARAQDMDAVVDQLLRFIIAGTQIDLTPAIGLALSRWIRAELDAFNANSDRMDALATKLFRVASAARNGQDELIDSIS